MKILINEDVYKMHTYKDAITKTEGAYVLYPGEIPKYLDPKKMTSTLSRGISA